MHAPEFWMTDGPEYYVAIMNMLKYGLYTQPVNWRKLASVAYVRHLSTISIIISN
jgi:hypothetical protein